MHADKRSVNRRLEALGLYIFVRAVRRAYIRGGLPPGGIITGIEIALQKNYSSGHQNNIFTYLFLIKLQNVIIN